MKSIFDGWTRQITRCLADGEGGYCARGYIRKQFPFDSERVDMIEDRIGKWIRKNMDVPESAMRGTFSGPPDVLAVVWANNEKKLDIEGFKMVDLLTQGYVPEESKEPACELVPAGI